MTSRGNQTGSEVQEKKKKAGETSSNYLRNSLLKGCEDTKIFCGLHRRLDDLMKQKGTEDCKHRETVSGKIRLPSTTASEGTPVYRYTFFATVKHLLLGLKKSRCRQ